MFFLILSLAVLHCSWVCVCVFKGLILSISCITGVLRSLSFGDIIQERANVIDWSSLFLFPSLSPSLPLSPMCFVGPMYILVKPNTCEVRVNDFTLKFPLVINNTEFSFWRKGGRNTSLGHKIGRSTDESPDRGSWRWLLSKEWSSSRCWCRRRSLQTVVWGEVESRITVMYKMLSTCLWSHSVNS